MAISIHTHSRLFRVVIASSVLTLAAGVWAAENDARRAAVLSITTPEVKQHVDALADDTFEGREAGSRGSRAAGGYIIERLKKCGLRGGGVKNGFYQPFGAYQNILGLVEGRDPELRQQIVLISAHYDHVGYGSNRNSYGPIGLIHNGADDNASGVAGLLEVADALAQLPQAPKRSILLAFWDGEEKGLLGSKHWVDNPTIPLARVPIMINVDMIGRLRNANLTMYGSRTSRGLRRLVSNQNDPSRLLLDFTWELKGDSDHYSFYTRDVPFLMMHTGMHGDYHRPSDDADKINAEGLKQISQLMFNVLVELAESPDVGGFRKQARLESRFDQQRIERPLAPPPGRLGLRWDEKAAAGGTIVVTSVAPGSAAANAGLRRGDRIVEFAGHAVHDPVQMRRLVLAAESPAVVKVERAGEPEPLEVNLNLAGPAVRLGIGWRTDEAEPGTIIVNRLTPGGPAELAGIHVNDRIQRINGQDFAGSEEFHRLATETPGNLELEVETAGQVRTLEIPPLEP